MGIYIYWHWQSASTVHLPLSEGKYTQHHLAVWFGNESRGLSEEALKACDFCIQIPMYGIIESMNISSSASIVLNHIVERRHEFFRRKLTEKESQWAI